MRHDIILKAHLKVTLYHLSINISKETKSRLYDTDTGIDFDIDLQIAWNYR